MWYVCMNSGWVDERIDGWAMDGQMNRLKDGQMDGQMDGWMDEPMEE